MNGVFMRCLRKISGHSRYAAGGLRDVEVREAMQFPSVDCLLLRFRLKYCRRLVCGGPAFLLALLGIPSLDGRRPLLEWSSQIALDLDVAFKSIGARRLSVADPRLEPSAWFTSCEKQYG